MAIPVKLFLIAGLLFCSAFFSSSEISLFSLTRLRVRRLQESGSSESWFIQKLLENPAKLLQVILIGNELVNTAISVLIASLCFDLLDGRVPGWALPIIPLFFASPLIILLGEVVPKALGYRAPEVIAKLCAPWLTFFSYLVRPMQWLLDHAVRWLLPVFVGIPNKTGTGQVLQMDEEAFRSILELGQSEGVVQPAEREFIHRVLELDDITVKNLMIPKERVFALPVNAPVQDVLAEVRRRGFSRIPLYRDDPQQIVGLLYSKDLIRLWREGVQSLQNLMRPAYFIPQSMVVSEALRTCQQNRIHIAIVVDEYGKFRGVITMHDILERIFNVPFVETVAAPEGTA